MTDDLQDALTETEEAESQPTSFDSSIDLEAMSDEERRIHDHFYAKYTKARQKDRDEIRRMQEKMESTIDFARRTLEERQQQPAKSPEEVDPFADHPGKAALEELDPVARQAVEFLVQSQVEAARRQAMEQIAPLTQRVQSVGREVSAQKVNELKAKWGAELVSKYADQVLDVVDKNPGLSMEKALLLVADEEAIEHRATALLRERNAARDRKLHGTAPIGSTRGGNRGEEALRRRKPNEGNRDFLRRLMRQQ